MPAGYLAEGTDKYAVKVGDVFKSVDDVKALELFNIENVGKIKLEDISSVLSLLHI